MQQIEFIHRNKLGEGKLIVEPAENNMLSITMYKPDGTKVGPELMNAAQVIELFCYSISGICRVSKD